MVRPQIRRVMRLDCSRAAATKYEIMAMMIIKSVSVIAEWHKNLKPLKSKLLNTPNREPSKTAVSVD